MATKEQTYDAGDFIGGKYITKETLADGPQQFTIQGVSTITFEAKNGRPAQEVLQLELGDDRKFSLSAKINIRILINAYGRSTPNWIGQGIILYVDPNVMYGTSLVGGIRVRIPKLTLEQQKAADIAETMPDSPLGSPVE